MFNFSEESFHKGIDSAIRKVKESTKNEEGKKIKENFTYKNTLENILSCVL